MSPLTELIADVAASRQRVVATVQGLIPEQEAFSSAPGGWSVPQVVEHLVLAEQAGINRIWQAAEGVLWGQPVWHGEPVHRGGAD